MKKISRFLNNTALIIGIIIAILLLIPLIPVVDQWYQLAIVQSASMEPGLPVGSLAIYKPRLDYYPGEVIVYRDKDERLIIHRIVEKKTRNSQVFF